MKLWKWERQNLPSVIHSIRTAIAATISLAVARLFGLPEAYWTAIATLVVMQSTLDATVLISVERIAATALGALAGALLANYFIGNLLVFAGAIFVLGLLCAAFRMEKSAYRYASITLAIIVLVPRSNAAWMALGTARSNFKTKAMGASGPSVKPADWRASIPVWSHLPYDTRVRTEWSSRVRPGH